MTPLERFNAWQKRKEPDQYGYTFRKVVEKAQSLGYHQADIAIACRDIRHWLTTNEDSQKANKKHWGKFILNWLKPKNYQQGGRLAPSNFD